MLPAKPFYLIRHGESVANSLEVAAGGGFDSPLTEKGQGQAKTLSPFLPQLDIQPHQVHHSSMIRAKDTAIFLNESLELPMTEWYELREHELGDWEERPWSEVSHRLEAREAPPNGEPHYEFAQRIQSIFTSILEESDDIPMIVCHGGVFHALGMLYEYGMSKIQNCHLHYFEPEPLFEDFPWRVHHFDIEGETLVKRQAPFCLSHALSRIA